MKNLNQRFKFTQCAVSFIFYRKLPAVFYTLPVIRWWFSLGLSSLLPFFPCMRAMEIKFSKWEKLMEVIFNRFIIEGQPPPQLMCQNVQFLEWPLGLYQRPCYKELVYSSNVKLLLHGWPRTANFHLLVVYSWDCPLKIKLLQAPPGRFWPSGLTFDTCAFRCYPPFFVCLIVNHVS